MVVMVSGCFCDGVVVFWGCVFVVVCLCFCGGVAGFFVVAFLSFYGGVVVIL